MAAPKELQDRIRAIIKPWISTKKKPAFSILEMLVMCLLLSQPLSSRDLLAKLAQYFGWVRDLAVTTLHEEMFSFGIYESRTIRGYTELDDELSTMHDDFDFHSPIIVHETQDDEDVFMVNVDEARVFLRTHLAPRPSTPFPLVRLPAELRLSIYEMVLGLPKSGVQIRSTTELHVWTKDYHAPSALAVPHHTIFPEARAGTTLFPRFRAGSIKSHLALLSTSRQIYQEAMPVFYANNFVFEELEVARNRLRGVAPSRKEHIRHISFAWVPTTKVKIVEEMYSHLASMKGLLRIDIKICQGQWDAQTKRAYNLGGTFTPAKLPGFTKLRTLCELKQVTFYGDCDALREALKPKPKPAKQGQETKKKRVPKRKATNGDHEKGTSGGTKAKKAKKASTSKGAYDEME